jgi:hypothetical protein
VLYDRNRYREAKAAVGESLRLDPENPAYFFLRGAMSADEHHWQEGLNDADAGLALDPEHEGCLNLKARCLVKLGRDSHAGVTLESALQRNPDNAHTHANQGWRLLEAGEHKRALEHFREALRLDPELDWARAGIVEAMKARHFIYRIFFKYLSWMSRMTTQVQFAIVIGAYLAYRWVAGLARDNPESYGWLWPVLILYIAFAFLTWFAAPLFNLLLRLNRFGSLALSPDQRKGSTLFGLGLLTAILLGLATFLFEQSGNIVGSALGIRATINSVLLLIPVSIIFFLPAGQPRKTMTLVVLGLAGLAFLEIGTLYQAFQELNKAKVERANTFGSLFLYGIIGSQFLANYLAGQRQKH